MNKNEKRYPSKDIVDKYGVDEEYDDDDSTQGVFGHNSENRLPESGEEYSDEDEETSTVGVSNTKRKPISQDNNKLVKPQKTTGK